MIQTNPSDIKAIQVVYSSLIIGPLLFLIVSIFLISQGGAFVTDDVNFMNMMLLVALIMSVLTITTGIIIFKSRMKAISPDAEVKEKIIVYRATMIIRAALMEGAAFFSIVCFLLFGHYVFFVIALVCLGIMLVFFPTRTRIANEIKNNVEDLEAF